MKPLRMGMPVKPLYIGVSYNKGPRQFTEP